MHFSPSDLINNTKLFKSSFNDLFLEFNSTDFYFILACRFTHYTILYLLLRSTNLDKSPQGLFIKYKSTIQGIFSYISPATTYKHSSFCLLSNEIQHVACENTSLRESKVKWGGGTLMLVPRIYAT